MPDKTKKKTILTIDKLKLMINLGWTAEERVIPQILICSLKFFFNEQPKACLTDNLSDTICYGQMIEIIKKYCENKEFKLLEFLGYQLYLQLRAHLPEEVKIFIQLDKINGPVTDIFSANFSYSDNVI